MGILRTIFALSVVISHSDLVNGFALVGGKNAVRFFYVISGFLISYVLNNNKSYSDPIKFYINRALRLYPIYYFVAISTLILYLLINHIFFDIYKKISLGADSLLVFSNLFLFGQDWVMFSGIRDGSLAFFTDFRKSEFLLYTGLLVPQAWTLGVELSFYLIAPWILRDVKKILILLMFSILLRIFLISLGFGLNDPWTYRFFPTELSLFLMGALSHVYLLPFWKKILNKTKLRIEVASTVGLIVFSLMYSLIPMPDRIKLIFFMAALVVLLPLTFIFQDKYKFDKKIGDLSYPIYIGHVLIIYIVAFLFDREGITKTSFILMVNVIGSVLFAVALNYLVADRVERFRREIRMS